MQDHLLEYQDFHPNNERCLTCHHRKNELSLQSKLILRGNLLTVFPDRLLPLLQKQLPRHHQLLSKKSERLLLSQEILLSLQQFPDHLKLLLQLQSICKKQSNHLDRKKILHYIFFPFQDQHFQNH